GNATTERLSGKNPWESCSFSGDEPVPKRRGLRRGSQATEHQVQRTDANHGFARVRPPFIVFAVATVPSLPGKGSLHYPALRQHSKPSRSRFAVFPLQLPVRPILGKPLTIVEVVVLVVTPEFLQAWIVLGIELTRDLRSRNTIVHGGTRYQD